MLLQDFLPHPALRPYVQTFRVVHFDFAAHQTIPFKAYPPKPENCLTFAIFEPDDVQSWEAPQPNTCAPVWLTGQLISVVKKFPKKRCFNFQIVFQPTGLYRLLGIRASELTNHSLDATLVLEAGAIRALHEQLCSASNYSAMIALAETYVATLVKRARPATVCDALSQTILRTGGNTSLDWLASQACLSIKQFRRKFNEGIGLNPHHFSRIVRFTSAYNLHNKKPQLDWLSVALQTGYYDYQHLAKDYQAFTSQTPIAFHLLEGKSPERVLGLAEAVYKNR